MFENGYYYLFWGVYGTRAWRGKCEVKAIPGSSGVALSRAIEVS